MRKQMYSRGFTLIELLVVMGIIVILAAVIIAVPLDKIKAASDTVAENDIAFFGKISEGYALNHNGFYPATFDDLLSDGDMSTPPHPPSGYTYAIIPSPNGCTGGSSCTSVVYTAPLKSIEKLSTPFIRYESTTGKTCETANPNNACQ